MDGAREKFEIISIKMDVHRSGMIYLKELESLLWNLSEEERGPVGQFLIAYMKQTKKIIIKLGDFVTNILKAYQSGKFELDQLIRWRKEK